MTKVAWGALPKTPHSRITTPLPLEPMELEGEELGCWRLGECLGAGGFSEVYSATHIHLGVRAAIKLIHFQHLEREDIVERFRREALVLMECKHPNIIEAKEFSIDELYGSYLVLEQLEGYSLSALVEDNQGQLNFDWILGLVDQLCQALNEIHKRGLVHRDLKPSNIFLVPQKEGIPHLKLLDFGTTKVKLIDVDEHLTTTGLIIGTPHYIAPEQIREAGQVGAAADIYSLGAILYEMLTGALPHCATSAFQQLLCVLQEEPAPIRTYRPALAGTSLEALVERMLAKAPEKRPASALLVKQELEQALSLVHEVDAPLAQVCKAPEHLSLAYAMTTPLPTTRFALQQTKVLSAQELREPAQQSHQTPRGVLPTPTSLTMPVAPPIAESEASPAPPRRSRARWLRLGLVGLVGLVAALLCLLLFSPWRQWLRPPARQSNVGKKPPTPGAKSPFFSRMKLTLAVPATKARSVDPRPPRTTRRPARRAPSGPRRPKALSLRKQADYAYRKRRWKRALRLFHRYLKRYPHKLKEAKLKRQMSVCRCKLDIPLAWESCDPKGL